MYFFYLAYFNLHEISGVWVLNEKKKEPMIMLHI